MVLLRSGLSYAYGARRRISRYTRNRILNTLNSGARYGARLPLRYSAATLGAMAAYSGTRWALKRRARYRRFGRAIRMRPVRETKTDVQEIHRYYNEANNTWINHIKHWFGGAKPTDAPTLMPNLPGTTDNNKVHFDVFQHLFREDGVISPQDCSIDIKGMKFEIELGNRDYHEDIYVRTMLLRFKNPLPENFLPNQTGVFQSNSDEMFRDPYDKCKYLDFDANLPIESYKDDVKMSLKINKNRYAKYFDKVIKLGHRIDEGNVVVRARRDFNTANKRKLVIRWFPKGGYRFRIAMDGNDKKNWMEQRIQFLMFACRKSILGQTDAYGTSTDSPAEIDYKIRYTIYFKKVY